MSTKKEIKKLLRRQIESLSCSEVHALRGGQKDVLDCESICSEFYEDEPPESELEAAEYMINMLMESVWGRSLIEDCLHETYYQKQRREDPYTYYEVSRNDFMNTQKL